jgi:uncharacterized Zn finger protein
MASALLDIALAEKKPDDVVKWYDRPGTRERAGYFADSLDDKAAHAISQAYPDRAVKIWKRLADAETATTKVSAYPIAARYLRSVKETFVREKRGGEWNEYLEQLLEKNRYKLKFRIYQAGLSRCPTREALREHSAADMRWTNASESAPSLLEPPRA